MRGGKEGREKREEKRRGELSNVEEKIEGRGEQSRAEYGDEERIEKRVVVIWLKFKMK